MLSPRVLAPIVAGEFGVAWLAHAPIPEGPILWTVAPRHGLVVADFPGIAALLVAAWLAVAAIRG